MSITFIHTADWQLGKKFGGFAEEFAPIVRDARMTAIDRIAIVAQTVNAKHVLVAGDVFDALAVPPDLLRQTLARMAAYPTLVWHLLPGNHDFVSPGSLWQTLAALAVNIPAICLHVTPEPVEIEPGVWLLPAPLAARAMSTDPTGYMDTYTTPPGAIRIGIAHGSARGFGSMGDAQVPIDPARATSAKLDYLALGDWHGLTRIDDRTWYSGTPEPDGYRDNDPGFVLAVTITAAGAMPNVVTRRTAAFTWLNRTLSIAAASDLTAISAELKSRGAPVTPVLLALTVSGRVALAEMALLETVYADIRALVRHLDLEHAAVLPSATPADLATIFTGGLNVIAARVAARQSVAHGNADLAAERIAGRALQLLAQLAESTAP